MEERNVFQSTWRCDSCGETFSIEVGPVSITTEGATEPLDLADGDFVIEYMPCQICSGEMRRVVSVADLRDWGEQFV